MPVLSTLCREGQLTRWGIALTAAALASSAFVFPGFAQQARLSGFVSDRSDGQVLQGATVALYKGGRGEVPAYGTATNIIGVYQIQGIRPGRYFLQISFVGYRSYLDTIDLSANDVQTITVALEPDAEMLDEVVVEAGRLSGAAHITGGHQRIRPEEVEIIPAPDVTADLANYLATLPGIVTTGDQGGQFFVRGGEPTQNLTMLDGMVLYHPFHILGFYSAFPAEIINSVDLYAGGFGSRYGGRLSSVMDIRSRAGNNRRLEGAAAVSPFFGSLFFEGPIVPEFASVILSARESLIDRTADKLYDHPLDFRFGDAFAKVQITPSRRDRIAFTLLRTHDRGTLVADIADENDQEIRWTNRGGSFRWLTLPRTIPVAAELTISRSRHDMTQGASVDTLRFTTVSETRIGLDATFSEGSFLGQRSSTSAGWEVIMGRTQSNLGGLFQNLSTEERTAPSLAVYVEPDLSLGGGLRLVPGIRVQWYKVRQKPYLEPRLRLSWERGIHRLSGAAGLYHQQLVGINSRRDATSVFTAWTSIPRAEDDAAGQLGRTVLRSRIGSAVHALLGYRSAPTPGLEYSVEGFYKRINNLFVSEWTALPKFSTRLQPAVGRTIGFEARVELRRNPLYAYASYGFSNTIYTALEDAVQYWYGTDRLRYRPSHDRRHQVSVVLSTSVRGFDVSVRWQFGSGMPYTRALAFDSFALVDDIKTAFELEHSKRVIYERPFDSILPTYHRLDVSMKRTWHLSEAALTIQASAINIYDRRNVFYVDAFTMERRDQLPFVPSLGLEIAFE